MREVYAFGLLFLVYKTFFNECLKCQLIWGVLLINVIYAVAKNLGLLPKKSLQGQHIFITGAGSGIGKLMALRLAGKGCKLTLADLNFESVQQVQKLIGNENSLAVKCDVSSIKDVEECAKVCVQKFGDVDVLINNAGIVSGKKILENTPVLIQKTIEVNCISHHWTVRAFLPKMLQKKKGHIVTIASVAGTVGVNGLVDYCASKFGAVGFDESLRMELNQLKSNVKTTCICPYYIDTGMFSGVKSKFNYMLPILDENYAADRIINAILQDEPFVLMPWILNINMFFRSLLPVSIFDSCLNILGANKSMDHFVGRKQD